MSEGILPWRALGGHRGLAVPLDLLRADPVVVLQALEVLSGDLAGGVATGIQQPDAELRLVAAGSCNQQLRVRGTEDVVLAGVHVVFVAADEVEHLRLGHAGAVDEGILVVVAEGQRPLDLAGLHRLDDVVDRLLDLGRGLRLAVDDVPVDHHEVGLFGLDDLVHQFQGAPVGQRSVLGVVELHDLELAVRDGTSALRSPMIRAGWRRYRQLRIALLQPGCRSRPLPCRRQGFRGGGPKRRDSHYAFQGFRPWGMPNTKGPGVVI